MNTASRRVLFLLSFIEGASVMACELFSAKMVAPFFGGSLYVWAAVLGVTLFSLMSGYYLGGYISQKKKNQNLVYWVLLLAGFFLCIMPHSSFWSMTALVNFSVQWGTTISLMIFMFPPLLLMGMTSPMIINLINESVEETGKSAGSVYAISTFGGIIATFLVGFYLLPEFGIKWPCYFFGVALAMVPLIILIRRKIFRSAATLIPVFYVGLVNSRDVKMQSEHYNILYESEGVLGQVRVVDLPYYSSQGEWKMGRSLMVNNTAQTIMDVENPEFDLWEWSHFFPTAVSIYPQGSDVLLLGLGGGTLVQQFERLKFDVDVVEIDERVVHVAKEFFFINPLTNIFVDDARRYVNTCNKKYDVITLDLFLNETPPGHVLTLESFERMKEILNPGGMIMMNFYGFLTGEKGRASRCIIKTFQQAGFHLDVLATPGQEENRNLIFLAQTVKNDFTQTEYTEPHRDSITNLTAFFIDLESVDLNDAIVLRDEVPVLEKIYLPAALAWRRSSVQYNLIPFLNEGVGF